MRKIKYRIISVVFVSFVLMTGCEKTPTSVKNNINKYKKNKSLKNITVEYSDVNKLKETDLSKIKVIGNNLVLPKTANTERIKDVYIIKGKKNKGFFQKEEIIRQVFNIDKEKKLSKVKYDNGNTKEYSNKLYIGFKDDGWLSFIKRYDETYEKNVENLNYGEYQSYYLQRGEIDNNRILDYVKKASEEYNRINLNKELEFNPSCVCIFNGSGDIRIEGTYCYDGIDFSNEYIIKNEKGKEKYFRTDYLFIELSMEEDKSLSSSVQTGGFNIIKKERLDKVVSLQTAIDIVSVKLSGFKNVKICEIRPIYLSADSIKESKKSIEAHPYYLFKIDTHKKAIEYNKYAHILVSMENGSYFDDISMNGGKNILEEK